MFRTLSICAIKGFRPLQRPLLKAFSPVRFYSQRNIDDSSSTLQNLKASKANTLVNIVPQGELWVVERLGKYLKTLTSGVHILIPVIDSIRYRYTTKEVAFNVTNQTAITKDNVQVNIDGVVYFKVEDPYLASYNVQDYYYAISNLAQTTMRAEIGKIVLDTLFAERQNLNNSIVVGIEGIANGWGISIKRYEIMDINMPPLIRQAMELEAEAERKKRKSVLDSEASRISAEIVAQGQKTAVTLRSEANMIEAMNNARGEAFTTHIKAQAQAEALRKVSTAIIENGGQSAVSYQVAEK
ncbi:stomatin-like protein 2, mitochondrial, partial [Acrasis kona]